MSRTSFYSLFFFILGFSTFLNSQKNNNFYKSLKNAKGIEISHAPGIYDQSKSIDFKIKNTSGQELTYYTIDASGAKAQSNTFSISQPTIVKVDYKDSLGNKKCYVGSYIVNAKHHLPIVSLCVDHGRFFPPNGVYYGYLNTDSIPGKLITVGKAWQKQPIRAFAQFFIGNKMRDELALDVKTYGGMTLGWKEKSLQLSARKEKYGRSKIKVKLFENLPMDAFQHVVLRTSGNDQNKSRLQDRSISHVADELGINTKASRAVVLYINGQYWGIHNLREKVNGDYFKYRYNWKKENFTELQGSGFRNASFKSMVDYAKEHFNDSDYVEQMNERIDVESLFNFNIIQTYISNPDYRGNIRFYKHKNGKWKWVLYDTDLACRHDFVNRNFIRDRTFPSSRYWYNPGYATVLLNSMLKNETFKKQFTNQYCYLLSTYLSTNNFHEKFDLNKAIIEKEFPIHAQRRGNLYRESVKSWNSKYKRILQYFSKREKTAHAHLQKSLNLDSLKNISVEQNILGLFKGIKVNGSEVLCDRFSGQFFMDYTLDVEAQNKNHQYVFVKWSDGEKQRKRVLVPGDKKLKAIYKKRKASVLKDKLKVKHFYVKGSNKSPVYFVSLLNESFQDMNLDGFRLYEDVSGVKIKLKDVILKSGKTLIFCNNDSLVKKQVQKKSIAYKSIDLGTNFAYQVSFVLLDKKNCVVDVLEAVATDSMLVNASNYLFTNNKNKVKSKKMGLKKLKKIDFVSSLKRTIAVNAQSFFWLILSSSIGLLAFITFLLFRFGIININRNNTSIFLILFSCSLAFAQPVDSINPLAEDGDKVIADSLIVTNEEVEEYVPSDKFGNTSIQERLIDNKGRGDERFDGTRNFRVLLFDLIYRGGGNNLHLKDTIPKYYLWNPMPLYGLRQLQKVGFDEAVYLYSYNFEYWYPQWRLDSLKKEGFTYRCEPKAERYLPTYFQEVVDHANDSTAGYIYIHCWNGWHQSGLLSAYTLMQFCDYSNEKAIKYWESCTDGHYKGYRKVKDKIRAFRPMKGFSFTEEQKKKHCPCNKEFAIKETTSKDDQVNLSREDMMQKNYSKRYVVKAGDNLYKISIKYKTSISNIKRINGLKSDLIKVGQSLKIP